MVEPAIDSLESLSSESKPPALLVIEIREYGSVLFQVLLTGLHETLSSLCFTCCPLLMPLS